MSNLYATLHTNRGDIRIQLLPDAAPKTVANFVGLADGTGKYSGKNAAGTDSGPFYDSAVFHRVIEGFMIQGGDPLTKDEANQSRWGTGDPGYKIKAEFSDKAHVRGVLSAARSQDPNSAGSQFFICHGDPRFLDKQYTAYGKLIKGDDVLEKIATTPTAPGDRPLKRVTLESVKIVPRDSIK